MSEVEVKARLTNGEQVIDELTRRGLIFSKPQRQEDKIFIDSSISYSKLTHGSVVIRIRTVSNKHTFTAKQRLENELARVEHETDISNPEETEKILQLLGYKKVVEVNKIRQVASYKDISICIDKVDNLGTFIEAERLTDEQGSEKTQTNLNAFLLSLGIKTEDFITKGYDTLIYELTNG